MRRRDFITLLGGAAAAWPMEARAQERLPTPTIGWLDLIDPNSDTIAGGTLVGFKQGLAEQGYVVGQNVNLEFRNAQGDAERARVLAADLVRRQVAVIVTPTGGVAHAAKAATQSIPIVFNMGGDPVEEGLVASFNRPGRNLTGVVILSTEIAAKRLELLHELVPKAQSIEAVTRMTPGSGSDFSRAQARGFQAGALAHGVHLLLFNVGTDGDIAGAFANAVQQGAGALLVGSDRSLTAIMDQMISLANHYSLPTLFFPSRSVAAGALASYGINTLDVSRQVGLYAGRILKGEKPADLPVRTPNKLELAINLKTAKTLGLTVPPNLLAIADELIE
jgi:putative ABC transport system substrate-binding protein